MSRHDPGPVQILARLALQSDRYVDDDEFNRAVDDVLNKPVYDAAPDLLTAAENLMVEDGASDNGLCHRGLLTREECPHCQRWDALRAAIKKAKGEL